VGQWKLIGSRDQPKSLVNLSGENPEAINHLKDEPEIVERLLARHKAWVQEVMPQPF
jgi:hypothetical protein